MSPYSEQDLDEIDRDPLRARAYYWRVSQKLKLTGDPRLARLGDMILLDLDEIIAAQFHETPHGG